MPGKQNHHAAAVDVIGRVLWSVRVSNDQQALAELIGRIHADDQVVWAVDLIVAKLALLVAHRADLVEDWVVRTLNRLRRLMVGICPAVERALTFTNVATLILISAFQSPQQIRAVGRDALVAYLRRHQVTARHAAKVADQVVAAAAQQSMTLPGADTAAALAAELAVHSLQLHRGLKDADKAIDVAFADRPQADIIRSPCPAWEHWPPRSSPSLSVTCPHSPVPTIWPPTTVWPPVSRDSGRRSGNLRRPRTPTLLRRTSPTPFSAIGPRCLSENPGRVNAKPLRVAPPASPDPTENPEQGQAGPIEEN
jgi:hypothetical protein